MAGMAATASALPPTACISDSDFWPIVKDNVIPYCCEALFLRPVLCDAARRICQDVFYLENKFRKDASEASSACFLAAFRVNEYVFVRYAESASMAGVLAAHPCQSATSRGETSEGDFSTIMDVLAQHFNVPMENILFDAFPIASGTPQATCVPDYTRDNLLRFREEFKIDGTLYAVLRLELM